MGLGFALTGALTWLIAPIATPDQAAAGAARSHDKEDQQNVELIHLSKQILELTKEVRDLTASDGPAK